MWSSDSDGELSAPAAALDNSSSTSPATASPPPSPTPAASLGSRRHRHRRQKKNNKPTASTPPGEEEEEPSPDAEDVWRGAQWEAAWPGRGHPKKPVVLAEEDGRDGVGRSRSLTDDDLEELKGCADLGFGFSYDEIPELRDTLPALELCYSMTQRLLDDPATQQAKTEAEAAADVMPAAPPVTNWKISSPGDSPEEVKARLKYWAQAVACTVRLCS